MRLKRKIIDPKTSQGSISLEPEETEDLWHVYNLILVGDRVRTSTVRKIVNVSATGSSSTKERKRITLTILVEKVDFDPASCVLRLSGRNVEENEWVKLGAAHTIQVELHKSFIIEKDYWDPLSLERVDDACDAAKRAEVAALMIDEGMANLYLLTDNMSITRAHINTPIPRKRMQSHTGHEKAMERFFSTVYDSVSRSVDFTVVKCLIIAGPGFIKEQFQKFMLIRAVQQEHKNIIENKSKIVIVSASSAFKHSMKEVLNDKLVLEKINDTKAAKEVQSLNRFYVTLQTEPARATYGVKSVVKANLHNAIEVLLISDNLFRAQDIPQRKMYVSLTENVKDNGGEVRIFSSLHVSGEQLAKFAGVAAILRFPLHDLEDSDSDSEDSDVVKKEKIIKKKIDVNNNKEEKGDGKKNGKMEKEEKKNGKIEKKNEENEDEDEKKEMEKKGDGKKSSKAHHKGVFVESAYADLGDESGDEYDEGDDDEV